MRFLLAALAVLALAGCGGSSSAAPKADPRQAALKVLDQIVHNRYTEAWDDLHPTDQGVAPRAEYVGCEQVGDRDHRSVRIVGVRTFVTRRRFVCREQAVCQARHAGGSSSPPHIHLVAPARGK
jgi:hypothetical protein